MCLFSETYLWQSRLYILWVPHLWKMHRESVLKILAIQKPSCFLASSCNFPLIVFLYIKYQMLGSSDLEDFWVSPIYGGANSLDTAVWVIFCSLQFPTGKLTAASVSGGPQ